jgi:tRNA(fMet)-specific endonuclease VapC
LSYLLDTNACIAIINGRPVTVRDRLHAAILAGETIAISTVSLFEFWYGVTKSERSERNSERLAIFLAPLEVVEFGADDASAAGSIRADLERTGRPIGAYDYMIAAQALQRGMTLVTANVDEFKRVSGLTWENWAA